MFHNSLRLKLAVLGSLGSLVVLPGTSQAQWWWPSWYPQMSAYGDRGANKAPLFGYPSPYPYSGRGGLPNDDVISQQANLLREEVYRSRSATRMKIFDEWKYYRDNTPTYEETRQRSLKDRLSQAVNNPPLSAIWSGATLNDLVSIIHQTETAAGVRGPTVDLARDVVASINWTTNPDAPGLGMVKNGSTELRWPATLALARFEPQRREIARLLDEAITAARERSPNARKLASQLSDRLDAMREDLRALRPTETPEEYLEAAGHLRRMSDAVASLKNPGAYRLLGERIQAGTVGDLVDQMTARGLRIGAAAPGDESYYTALYDAMATYERGLNRMTKGEGRANARAAAGQ